MRQSAPTVMPSLRKSKPSLRPERASRSPAVMVPAVHRPRRSGSDIAPSGAICAADSESAPPEPFVRLTLRPLLDVCAPA